MKWIKTHNGGAFNMHRWEAQTKGPICLITRGVVTYTLTINGQVEGHGLTLGDVKETCKELIA